MSRGAPDWTRAIKLLGIGPADELLTVRVDSEGNLTVVQIPHHTSHEDGGSDEVNVEGLSGVLLEEQKAKFSFVGLRANFPTPGVAGKLLFATDEKITYRDTGVGFSKAGVVDHADLDGVGADDHHSQLHNTAHQDGGADEISVAGLSGLLADPQTPLAHKTSHQSGGTDELSVAGLSGLLADPQEPKLTQGLDADKPAAGTPGLLYWATDTEILYRDNGTSWVETVRGESVTRLAQLSERVHSSLTGVGTDDHHAKLHAISHQNGGVDEISVAGLSGLLADPQTPTGHYTSHQNGGADEISVAGLSGVLADAQVPQSHNNTKHSVNYAQIWFGWATEYNGYAPWGAFYDLDLSSTVGANLALVVLKVENNSGYNVSYWFRQNGDTGSISDTGASGAVVDSGAGVNIVVRTDASGIIEWQCSQGNISTVVRVVCFIRVGS